VPHFFKIGISTDFFVRVLPGGNYIDGPLELNGGATFWQRGVCVPVAAVLFVFHMNKNVLRYDSLICELPSMFFNVNPASETVATVRLRVAKSPPTAQLSSRCFGWLGLSYIVYLPLFFFPPGIVADAPQLNTLHLTDLRSQADVRFFWRRLFIFPLARGSFSSTKYKLWLMC